MDLDRFGFNGMSLLDGEHLEMALSLKHGLTKEPWSDQEALLLTNRRIIHLSRNGRGRELAFAALGDIQAVEVRNSAKQKTPLMWGVLGLIAGLILFQVLRTSFENLFVASAAGVVAGSLGVILILDYLLFPGEAMLVLQAGSAQIHGHIQSPRISRDVYAFINRVFQLKTSGGDMVEGEQIAPDEVTDAPLQDSPSPTADWAPHPGPTENEHPGEGTGSRPQQS